MPNLLQHSLVPQHWPGEAIDVLGPRKVDFSRVLKCISILCLGRCLRHFELVFLAFLHVVTVDLALRVDGCGDFGGLQGTQQCVED